MAAMERREALALNAFGAGRILAWALQRAGLLRLSV
jgi:hypothetical protein